MDARGDVCCSSLLVPCSLKLLVKLEAEMLGRILLLFSTFAVFHGEIQSMQMSGRPFNALRTWLAAFSTYERPLLATYCQRKS